MLGQAEVAGFLLERGLITPRSIVEGDLVVRDASSRNRNFRVERRSGASYLLKHGVGQEGVATVAHEAGVYQALTDADPLLRRYLPAFYGYDAAERVLILELVGSSRDARTHYLRHGRFSMQHGAAMGQALGRLHRLTRLGTPALAPERAPWVLSAHRPSLSLFRDSSAASIELVKIIQHAPGFAAHLDRLRAGWRIECLIHNDVKWDNFLVYAPGASRRLTGLKLVDWEAAGHGDARWDIGSLLSHYLSFWIFSIPITGQTPPERFPALAAYPLERMQPAVRACWQAYVAELALDSMAAQQCLGGAVELAAARLVLTAFEAAQVSLQLTSNLVLHLQLALNMLERPREAAVHLLGIPTRLAVAA